LHVGHARASSTRPDGSAHATPTLFSIYAETFRLPTLRAAARLRNVRAHPLSLDPTGAGRARWTMRWKPALNAFSITFADRFLAAETS
jgi:hypothetical protein